MPVLAGVLLLVLVEITAVVAVAHWIGVGWTLLLMLGVSLLGLVLLRREGSRAWRSFSAAVAAGRPPGREVLDGVLLLAGALLIVFPGFVSDVLGLLCILPPTRRLLGRVLLGWAMNRGRATIVRVRADRGPVRPPDPDRRVIEGEIEPPDPRP